MAMNTSSSSSTSAAPSDFGTVVDAAIWRAAAGSSVHIPALGSRVYYFPQGHIEQCRSISVPSTSPSSSQPPSVPSPLPPPPPAAAFFHCRVLSIRFLCHPRTDELFAWLHLRPIPVPSSADVCDTSPSKNSAHDDDGFLGSSKDDISQVVSFIKILTPSDANNGGGFSVPKFCADEIFPPLDFETERPVQNLTILDLHGNSWQFRQVYRGTPRRHLLTTRWSKFVNSKKLVAGDSVVFMRRRTTGELYAGVRRALRGNYVSERWNCPADSVNGEEDRVNDWSGKKMLVVDAVLDALEKAARGMAFEVVCFPWPGWSDFVVKAEAVEASTAASWSSGMRIKQAMEVEDFTRTTFRRGTVSSASKPEIGPWSGSPWRMLQIAWDEPEVLRHDERVSPWEVEYDFPTSLHYAFPPTKKSKPLQNSGVLRDGEGEFIFPMPGLTNSLMEPLNQSFSDYTSPAGMQGARQNQNCDKNGIHRMSSDKFMGDGLEPNLEALTTKPNIGSQPSEDPFLVNGKSPDGTGLGGKEDTNSSPKVGPNSIQLFGKTIHMPKPADNVIDDIGKGKE